MQQQGTIDVSGQNNGGNVAINFSTSYTDSPASVINASGNTSNGGRVTISGTGASSATITGVINAQSQLGQGGTVTLSPGDTVNIQGATVNAFGGTESGAMTISAGNEVIQEGTIDASSSSGNGGNVTISAASVQQDGSIDASGQITVAK